MSRNILVTLVLVATVLALTASASGAVIGMAVTNGQVQVDKATISGNANLSEGSNVLTNSDVSRIQLSNGSRATLAPNSAARIYADHMILDRGLSIVASPSYKLRANGLEVAPAANQAQAQVAMKGSMVQVAALNGPVQVRDASGMLLAKISAGKALDITPSNGKSQASTVSGVLRQVGGKYMLTDQLTNVDAELIGGNLQKDLGRLVEASGNARTSIDRNSQIIEVAMLNRLESEESENGQGGQTANRRGLSKGAKIAIALVLIGGGVITGVVVANLSN